MSYSSAAVLQMPSSYVPVSGEEMEYLEGGAIKTTTEKCTNLKPLFMAMVGITSGAVAVYDSVKFLSSIGVGAVKAALKTWAAYSALATLTYNAMEITTACVGLKRQGYYYLHSVMGVFDYVTL